MTNQLYQGYAFDDAGAAIVGATVNLYDLNTTTPVRATTTTDANGLWTISHATEGRFDVEIVNGTSKRRRKYDDQVQFDTLEVATLRVRNPADTFDYDIVPAAITADRQLNLPLITGTDTLACLGLSQNFSVTQYIGDTANANMTLGLTINQGANDNHIVTLKSSDVATALTTAGGAISAVETDDFGALRKTSATLGGLQLDSLQADGGAAAAALRITSIGGTADTTDTSSSTALIHILIAEHNGSDALTYPGDTANIFAVAAYNTNFLSRFLIKGNGDAHLTNTTLTALDVEDDISLVRAYQRESSRGTGLLMSKWDDVVKANAEDLKRVGVLSSEGDFIIQQRFNSLIGGTLWQLYTQLQDTIERLTTTENKIEALHS